MRHSVIHTMKKLVRPALVLGIFVSLSLLSAVLTYSFHPAMQGSWSIKAVLPTIAPELDYKKLGAIQEGTAAQQAYLEAILFRTQAARREEIRKSLLEYCEHDTLAMVTLAEFLKS